MALATCAADTDATRKAHPITCAWADNSVNHAAAMRPKPSANVATVIGASCRAAHNRAISAVKRSSTREVNGIDTALTFTQRTGLPARHPARHNSRPGKVPHVTVTRMVAVVLGGGAGTRFGAGRPKQLLTLDGR